MDTKTSPEPHAVAPRAAPLVTLHPRSDLQTLRRAMEELIYLPLALTASRLLPEQPEEAVPNVDLYETDDGFVLKADLPGFRRKEIDVQVEPETIQVTARHGTGTRDGSGDQKAGEPAPGARQHYHVRQRQEESVSVRYRLPAEVDPGQTKATFLNGVLEVHMAKPKRARTHQVRVEVQG